MDWNRPIKERQLKSWEAILVLLVGIPVALVALFAFNIQTFGLRGPGDNAVNAVCMSHLNQVGHCLYLMAKENDSEELKGATIPDLLREAAHGGQLDEKCLHCPANGAPYHVFSVPATLFFQHSEIATANPVPIVMDSPGAHGKLGSNVLYSDGSVKRLTSEEAEKILTELSSVQIKADPEAQNEVKP